MQKTNIIKFIVIFIVSSAIILSGVSVYKSRISKKTKDAIITTGMTKGQNEYFQEQLRITGKQYGYINKGDYYLKKGDTDSAIVMFKIALKNAYSHATKGEAILSLADVYEKKKDYKKALEYVILDRDKYVNDWARAPLIERAKYLEYASKGEYELAVKYVKKALEVETSMPYNKGVPSQGFIDRLNDLIAAKDYIESLKKK